jgi:hypothetical protein
MRRRVQRQPAQLPRAARDRGRSAVPAAAIPVEPRTPLAREILGLQRAAGNAAVAASLQRQPKGGKKKVPAWLRDAQAAVSRIFPKDKLMQHVVVKDYGDLNATLQGIDYGAWTQSVTEIYIRDPTRFVDPGVPATKLWPGMILNYTLRHEAVHVRQFAKAGAPPATWQQMLEFEREAYAADLVWLDTAEARQQVPDKELRAALTAGAKQTLSNVNAALAAAGKLRGAKREAALHKRMIADALIPPDAKLDPRELYRQP